MSCLNAHFRHHKIKNKSAFFGRHASKIDCVKHLGKLPYFWQNHEHHPFTCVEYAMLPRRLSAFSCDDSDSS